HIVETLVRRKYTVRVMDNFSSGKLENLSAVKGKFELVRADIRSKNACLKALKGVDAVLHQAALRSVPKSLRCPQEYNEVNIQGTLNLLEAAVENRLKSFVFASSSSVYGDTKNFPERENFLPQPISPYALTKLTGEHYCRMFTLHYKLPTVALRYFNVFGQRQSLDDEYAVVVPKFISCILHDQQPPIFGTGKQSRDFTYVGNVVEANILAMSNLRAQGEVFNIASGKDYTVLELAAILNKQMHKQIKPKFLAIRPGDVFKTLADISKAKKVLGFRPKVDFIRGLALSVEYFKGKK
ncbi:MAG: NAD-dependent epimerase/dehydratase family protein, partial [Candidatus Omnitrophica bacterium]|nr:NAD-dependent epimerase/dehydratase family protein [Candidatus Omnitrophota bacterium]